MLKLDFKLTRQSQEDDIMSWPTIAPNEFRWSLKGCPPAGPNGFLWQDQRLKYSHPRKGLSWDQWAAEATVCPETWASVWSLCDDLDLWSWPTSQGNFHMMDGRQYEARIQVADRRLESQGQVHGAPAGVAEAVQCFHRHLQGIVGWNDRDDE